MRHYVLVGLLASACNSMAAADPVLEIRRCETPLWLEVSDITADRSWVLRSCGVGPVDVDNGDESFHTRFPHFRLERDGDAWSVWTEVESTDGAAGRTRLTADRQPTRWTTADAGSYTLRLWPRQAPHDVQIRADATADVILRELAKVSGLQIDGIELQGPEPQTFNFASIDHAEVVRLAVSGAWLLQTGPARYQLGLPRARGDAGQDRAALLQIVRPREPGDFPQPAIDLLEELATHAREHGHNAQAREHLSAALDLLKPHVTGNLELQLTLQIELAELLTADEQIEAAQTVLVMPQLDQDPPELVLRALALRLAWGQTDGLQSQLEIVGARLLAMPEAVSRLDRLLLAAVHAGAQVELSTLQEALATQRDALQSWRDLDADLWSWARYSQRQLLANELALASALIDSQDIPAARSRLAVAQWLQQMSREQPQSRLQKLQERLAATPDEAEVAP